MIHRQRLLINERWRHLLDDFFRMVHVHVLRFDVDVPVDDFGHVQFDVNTVTEEIIRSLVDKARDVDSLFCVLIAVALISKERCKHAQA